TFSTVAGDTTPRLNVACPGIEGVLTTNDWPLASTVTVLPWPTILTSRGSILRTVIGAPASWLLAWASTLLRFAALYKVAESLAAPPLTSGGLDPPHPATSAATANSAVNPFALVPMSAPPFSGYSPQTYRRRRRPSVPLGSHLNPTGSSSTGPLGVKPKRLLSAAGPPGRMPRVID